jgi:hypothetical protein
MPTLWSYLRFSTPEQRLGDSERRQIARGQGWAIDNHYDYDDSYRDEGVSAFRGDNATRGDLARLLANIRDGLIPLGDAIWFENLDRLSRQPPYQSIKLFQAIIDAGVAIVVDELDDDDEPLFLDRERLIREDHLLDRVYGELKRAHRESKRKSRMEQQTFARKRADARAGKVAFMGKRCKTWLRLLDEPDEQHLWYAGIPDRVRIVNRAYQLAADGIGVNRIAELFEGIEPRMDDRNWKGRTRDWHGSYLLQLLKDDAVLGFYQPHRWIDGKRVPESAPIKCYPEIVDPVLVARARRAIEQRRTCGKGRKGKVYSNIVSGLGVCPECGGGLYLSNPGPGQGQPKLCCYNAKFHRCVNRARFPYRAFESALLGMVGIGMQRLIADLTPREHDHYRREIEEREAAIVVKQATLDSLFERWTNHTSSAARQAADRQIERLTATIDADRNELDLLRRNSRFSALTAPYDATFSERFAKSVARLNSDNEAERYAARAQLAQELRQRVAFVILQRDSSIAVRVTEPGMALVDARFGHDGLTAIDVIDRDGTVLTTYAGPSLALLEPISRAA